MYVTKNLKQINFLKLKNINNTTGSMKINVVIVH